MCLLTPVCLPFTGLPFTDGHHELWNVCTGCLLVGSVCARRVPVRVYYYGCRSEPAPAPHLSCKDPAWASSLRTTYHVIRILPLLWYALESLSRHSHPLSLAISIKPTWSSLLGGFHLNRRHWCDPTLLCRQASVAAGTDDPRMVFHFDEESRCLLVEPAAANDPQMVRKNR